jgi:RNA polymerase sigma-70 factor (ECF subfamily)
MYNYDILDDKELIALLQKNDRHAFTEIYNRYWKKLFSVAANKIKDLSEAEEIVQDIFVSIWNRKDNLTVIDTLGSYLAVSVKYRVIKALDKRNNHQKYSDYAKGILSFTNNSTEEWVEFEELKSRLSELVAELPEKCQLVYKLSRESGLPQKKIAQEMGISVKTVEAHLSKALKMLRARLNQILL